MDSHVNLTGCLRCPMDALKKPMGCFRAHVAFLRHRGPMDCLGIPIECPRDLINAQVAPIDFLSGNHGFPEKSHALPKDSFWCPKDGVSQTSDGFRQILF
eukprot:2526565-Pyramimonas_sp.AAC.1